MKTNYQIKHRFQVLQKLRLALVDQMLQGYNKFMQYKRTLLALEEVSLEKYL